MAFETVLNPLLNPLLESIGHFWALVILVVVINLIITTIYKYTTDQSLMKDLKDELKAFQKQIKELKSHPGEALKVQKKMMQTNSKYMMHSMKPMLYTFLPIILFFGWMNAHLAYLPLMPSEEFSITMEFNEGVGGNVILTLPDEGIKSINGLNQAIQAEKATWVLKGEMGEYLLTYNFNNNDYSNEILISNYKEYVNPVVKIKKDGIKTITVGNKIIKPIQKIPLLKNLPWIGNFGWLGTYILLSIISSMSLRKIMKVY